MLGYDAAHWHAVLNDLPAALLLVAVLFDVAAAITKRESLMWAAIWTLWAGVIGGWAAVIAGELAEDAIANDHGEAIHELMETHETLALFTMGVFTVVLGWKLWRRFRVSPAEEWVLRILSVAGLVLIIATGVYGGKLMFEHAAGIPTKTMQAEMQDREKAHHHEEGEAEEHEHPSAGTDTTHHDALGNPPHSH